MVNFLNDLFTTPYLCYKHLPQFGKKYLIYLSITNSKQFQMPTQIEFYLHAQLKHPEEIQIAV